MEFDKKPLTEGDISSIVGDLYMIRRKLEASSNCRETSLSITKIDEAAMWIKQIPVQM